MICERCQKSEATTQSSNAWDKFYMDRICDDCYHQEIYERHRYDGMSQEQVAKAKEKERQNEDK